MVWAREGGERAPVALCREPTEPAGETGGGKHTASQSSRRDGRTPQPPPGCGGTGQRQAALSGELRGRKRAQKPGRDWPGFFASPTDCYVMPPEGGRLRCERPLPLQAEGCHSRQGGIPFGAAFPHSAWSRKTSKIPERAARRDFPALRGHAPRSAFCGGIFTARPATDPSAYSSWGNCRWGCTAM